MILADFTFPPAKVPLRIITPLAGCSQEIPNAQERETVDNANPGSYAESEIQMPGELTWD